MPQGNINTPDAGDLDTDARRYAAERGWATSDGSYPIRPLDNHGRADLEKAIRAVGRGGGSHDAIRRHIIKRARVLGLSDMIPDNWSGGGGMRSSDLAQATPLDVPSSPVEFRAANVSDVNFDQRLIEVVAVPYEEPATVQYRGEFWSEVFSRGAFDGIETRQGQIRANRNHDKTQTIGKALRWWPERSEGLVGEIRVAKTDRGDETLALADEDMLSASIGFGVRGRDQVLDKRSMVRRVNKAFVDHLSFVESPAYDGAKVLAVRGDESGIDDRPPLKTPGLDDLIVFMSSRKG